MKKSNLSLLVICFFVSCQLVFTQESKNLAEKLGYPKDSKLLIIHADDLGLSHSTNVAAIKDGRPVDTTMGFTPVEGIPSHTSCGDIDASVVFELQASGMSMSEINELLSARSGFRALVGRPCGFRELVLENGEPDQALARKILLYDIVKYVGAYAAVLGGVDALCFVAEDPRQAGPFIKAARRELSFLGRVKAAVLKGDIWRIMSCRAAAVEKES